MKTRDIFIFSLLVYRRSSIPSPNRAIILIGLVVENPLVVEDGQYFLGKNTPATGFPHHPSLQRGGFLNFFICTVTSTSIHPSTPTQPSTTTFLSTVREEQNIYSPALLTRRHTRYAFQIFSSSSLLSEGILCLLFSSYLILFSLALLVCA